MEKRENPEKPPQIPTLATTVVPLVIPRFELGTPVEIDECLIADYFCIIISRHQNVIQNQNIIVGNLSIENVGKFKYLGVRVANTKDII